MLQQHGGNIYAGQFELDFSANINPMGMPKAVRQAAIEGVLLSERYPDLYCRRLKEALSKAEGMPPGQLILGAGAAELIYAAARAIRPPVSLIAAPSFAEYELAVADIGRTDHYLLREEDGFAVREDFLERIDDTVELIFLTNPNNPTGRLIDQELLLRIVRKCEQKKVRLVVDECFLELCGEGRERSLKPLVKSGDYPHLFVLDAFTKKYAMPGLRLGYGYCSDGELLRRMNAAVPPWNISLPAQLAGTAALSQKGYLEDTLALITRERRFLAKELSGLGWKVFEPAANYIFFRGPKQLAEDCADKGILIRDCSSFRGLCEGYYRIAVRTHEENEKLIRTFAELAR